VDAAAEAEFADLVRTRWSNLVRAAIFLGAAASDAEEIAQLTLVRCYAKWHRVVAAQNREAYVYRMLLNQFRDTRRTRWWRSRIDVQPEALPDHGVADASDRIALTDAVDRALDGLSQEHREVVVLRYFVQLTEAQTADALGIAPGTVKSRLSRSLAHLAGSAHLSDLAEEHR